MSAVDSGRWTCPGCGRTVTVRGTDGDCHTAIVAVQHRHGRAHRRITPLPAPRIATSQPVGDETTPPGISTPAGPSRAAQGNSGRNGDRT